MNCSACGTENDDGSKFCMTCGGPLGTAEAPDASASPPLGAESAGAGGSADASGSDGGATGEDAPAPPPADPPSFAPPAPSDSATFAPPPAAPAPSFPPPEPAAPAYPPPAPPPAEPAAPAWGQPAPAQPAGPPPGAPGGWGQPAGAPGPPPGPPGAPQWGQPAPAHPGYAPPPAAPAGPPDPNGIGVAIGRWSNGPKKHARTAVAVAASSLKEGETVEAAIAGRLEGNHAVVVLTDQGVVLADERQWKPTLERFELNPQFQVQGWQDDRTASLTFVVDGRQMVLDQIGDRPLAVEMAQRIRYRIGS